MKATNLEKKQIDLVKESIRVYEKWMECKTLFQGSTFCFADIESFVDDRGKSHLFRLKEMSHELFRNAKDAHYKEKLYDMTIGYIFHEAMKLRENTYQLEYYRPQCDIGRHRLTEPEKKVVYEIGLLVKKAEVRLKEGFKEIRTLLNELLGQISDLIILYKHNYLLPRFIFENEKTLIKIYGKKGYTNLLNILYADGRHLLIFKAAESYLESQYYDTARNLFRRSLRLEPNNPSALFFYSYASAYHFYFKNMFTRALGLAEKALSMAISDKMKSAHEDHLRKLIAELSEEVTSG